MVTLTVETNETAILTVESAETVTLEAETVIAIPGETYTGSYEFNPEQLRFDNLGRGNTNCIIGGFIWHRTSL